MNQYTQLSRFRILLLMGGAALIFTGIVLRLYFIQIIQAPDLIKQNSRSRNYYTILPAARGFIYDCFKRPLALNFKRYTLNFDTARIDDATEIVKIKNILALSSEEWDAYMAKMLKKGPRWRDWIKNLTKRQKDEIKELDIPGVGFLEDPIRCYPEGSLAAPLIGYTGRDNKGLGGIEFTLDSELEGQSQSVTDVVKDIVCRPLLTRDLTKLITRGADVILTIDGYIQYIVERELEKVVTEQNAISAHAIVMQPQTGDILAFASYPTFDPNQYSDYLKKPALLRNRILTDVYEPGSVLKPFVLAAALEKGVVTPSTPIDCENGLYIFPGKPRGIRDDIHRFGILTVHDVLVKSSNIGMVKIAQRLGANSEDYLEQARIIRGYLKAFGFKDYRDEDKKNTTLLQGESHGLLRPAESWLQSSIGAVPFGQEMATNSLILCAAYGALANRGVYKPPRIVKGFQGIDGKFYSEVPEPPHDVIKDKRVIDLIVRMMIDVTEDEEGTGTLVRIPGFHIAGKTGTAQKYDPETHGYGKGKRIASFAGFFPAEAPKAVIFVMVDEPKKGKYGGKVSGPVWKTIAGELIAYWGLTPTYKEDPLLQETENKPKPKTTVAVKQHTPRTFGVRKVMPFSIHRDWTREVGVMPNLIGLTTREAYIQLTLHGLKAKFEGSGKIIEQSIPGGTPLGAREDAGTLRCEPVLSDPAIEESSALVAQR